MLLLLVVLGSGGALGAECTAGLVPCLRADLATALWRAAQARSLRLLPGLTLDRREDRPPATGPPAPGLWAAADRLFDTHSLYWNLLPGLDLTVSKEQGTDFQLGLARCHHGEERTFKFGMRRMKFMMLPIMYKLGVITTLLTLLTVFALKGLTIGVLLLIMSTAGLVAKFKWAHHGGYGGYSANGKEVHVHVHGGGPHGAPVYHSHPPVHYDDWVREDRLEEQRPGVVHQVHHHPPQVHHQPGVVHHQPGVVHHSRLSPSRLPLESTPSPWASYIGDQTL